MEPDLKDNITSQDAWLRGLFLLLFVVILAVAKVVGYAVVVLQFLFTVFSGQTNDNLLQFGAAVSLYIFQIWRFLTYNTDVKPFPFTPWPEAQEIQEATKEERLP